MTRSDRPGASLDGIRGPLARLPAVGRAMARLLRRWSLASGRRPNRPAGAGGRPPSQAPGRTAAIARDDYPGDATGPITISYQPFDDDRPDPGEVVWAWVPFEEDHSRGKDRPALIIGRDGPWLLALQVTSQDHDRDAAAEARSGRWWLDIGTGGWDPRGRASEVRVNRVVRLSPDRVRRIGARLARDRFDRVAAAVARHY